jgi:hypothetical protein
MNLLSTEKDTESDDKANLFGFSSRAGGGKDFGSGPDANGLLTADHVLRARSPGTLSNFSVDDNGQLRIGRHPLLGVPSIRHLSRSPIRPQEIPGALRAFWIKNKGLAWVLLSQVFMCLMNVSTRVLEVEGNNGKGFHPLQVLSTAANRNDSNVWLTFCR